MFKSESNKDKLFTIGLMVLCVVAFVVSYNQAEDIYEEVEVSDG